MAFIRPSLAAPPVTLRTWKRRGNIAARNAQSAHLRAGLHGRQHGRQVLTDGVARWLDARYVGKPCAESVVVVVVPPRPSIQATIGFVLEVWKRSLNRLLSCSQSSGLIVSSLSGSDVVSGSRRAIVTAAAADSPPCTSGAEQSSVATAA